ncbi:MAG TPA: AAA family ATPase [Candidatus Acidoferrales bacterium]|nr:AAA family ATPase [Candidatus Acidoferrales bacterium]
MRIQTLALKNFRSHQETALELDRFTFIRGPNGCGKSSIQMALEYLFTGRCALTDAIGRGAEALIRSGEKELAVSATLESGETICRRRTPRAQIVEINGNRVPVDAAENFLTNQFGVADVLSAVLNSGRFVEMPQAEQRRFLAQLIGAGKVEIPVEIRDALCAVKEEPPILTSVGDVEAAHKRFHGLRKEAGRALKAFGHTEKPDIPPDLPTVQEVGQKLEGLRQQRERLIAQKAEEDACRQNAQIRWRQVQAEIDEISANILSPSEEQELLRREAQRSHADALGQELAALLAEQRTVEKARATAQGFKEKCPTCGQPVSAAMKAKEGEALRERLASLEVLIQGTREKLDGCADIEAAMSPLDAHRRAVARRARLLEGQSEVQAVQQPDAAGLESRMTILAERINNGNRVLEKIRQVQASQENWEAQVRGKSSVEARIGLLDKLVEFLAPSGAWMGQASGRIGSFAESLNQRLAAFGYTCAFRLKPFEVRISSSTDHWRGLCLQQISESERFRFSVAFQLAVASAAGIRFIVIDGADRLDKERRKLLTALLSNSDVEQAIVLATSEEPPPSVLPAGVRFLSLGGGMKHDQRVGYFESSPTCKSGFSTP